jgi:hypothetical protein
MIEIFIFIPGFTKPPTSYASEIMFEMPHSQLMSYEKFVEDHIDVMLPLLNIKEGIIEGLSKFFSGSMVGNGSVNLPFPAFGKEMVGNSSNQNPQKNIHSFFDDAGNLHLTLDPLLWIGFLLVILYWVAYSLFSLLGIFIKGAFNYICDWLFEYYHGQRRS